MDAMADTRFVMRINSGGTDTYVPKKVPPSVMHCHY